MEAVEGKQETTDFEAISSCLDDHLSRMDELSGFILDKVVMIRDIRKDPDKEAEADQITGESFVQRITSKLSRFQHLNKRLDDINIGLAKIV